MFAVKRIFLSNKRPGHYICTGSARNCDRPRKGSKIIKELLQEEGSDKGRKRITEQKYPSKSVSPEEKKNLKNSLNALLESVTVESEQNNKDENIDMREFLKVQIERKEKKKQKKENLGALLLEAAEKVAKDLGGDTKTTKEDLFKHLKTVQIAEGAEVQETPEPSMTEVAVEGKSISGSLEEVLAANRLNIFERSSEEEAGETVKLNIWDKLEEEELAYMMRKPPRNQLEEWILWTEQGKLWKFPIDNDQGMEKEGEVDFTQHVFLEEHLEPWCPKQGPLKKFMELVLVGLSKNPYLTVEDKKEHIFWYRDYFEKKKKLLQELGAFGAGKEIGESSKPQ